MTKSKAETKDGRRKSGDKHGKEARERDPKGPVGDERPCDTPAAGPHARPELTNRESTPGTGLLPDPDDPAEAPDSASS